MIEDNMDKTKTIRITGKAQISAPPDRTKIFIDISKEKKEYHEAMNYGGKASEELKEIVVRAGFQEKDLKTLSWNIDTKYEENYNPNQIHQRIFLGYEYQHKFVIEFGLDHVLAGKLLNELVQSQLNPKVKITYTIAEVEPYREKLLKLAIEDSMHKAEIITKTAGINLGEIVTIDYSWSQINVSRNGDRFIAAPEFLQTRGIHSIPDITPADIELTDTISISWSLK